MFSQSLFKYNFLKVLVHRTRLHKSSKNTTQISISTSPEVIENKTKSIALNYDKITVKELKEELNNLGLSTSGKKIKLFVRLKEHLKEKDVRIEDFIAIHDNYSPESVQKQAANPMSNMIMANINEEIPNENSPKFIPDLDQSIVEKVLFHSALGSESDYHMMLAKDLAFKLDESNIDLIFKIIDRIGVKIVLELFKKTQVKEAEGGVMTKTGKKRRSSGGVFIHILQSMAADEKETRIIKSDIDSIFKEDTIKLDDEKINNIDPIMKEHKVKVQETNFENQTLNSIFLKTYFNPNSAKSPDSLSKSESEKLTDKTQQKKVSSLLKNIDSKLPLSQSLFTSKLVNSSQKHPNKISTQTFNNPSKMNQQNYVNVTKNTNLPDYLSQNHIQYDERKKFRDYLYANIDNDDSKNISETSDHKTTLGFSQNLKVSDILDFFDDPLQQDLNPNRRLEHFIKYGSGWDNFDEVKKFISSMKTVDENGDMIEEIYSDDDVYLHYSKSAKMYSSSGPDLLCYQIPDILKDEEDQRINNNHLRIFEQLTPQFVDELVQNVTVRSVRLEALKELMIEMAEMNFPFPEKFTTEQWRFLLTLDGGYSMARYMFTIATKEDDDQKILDHITKKNEESYGELRWDEQFRQELEAENNNINGPKFDWETFKYACEQLQMDGILEQSQLHNSNLLFLYSHDLFRLDVMKLAKRLVEQQKRGLMMSVQRFVDRYNVENQENQHFPSRHHFVPPCQVEKTFEHQYVQHMVSEASEPLVIDFSVLKSMDINVKEDYHKSNFHPIKKAFANIRVFEAINKCSPMPLDLHLTSLEGGYLPKGWAKRLPKGGNYNWMEKYVKLTKKSYDEIFPKENIVYISQASNNDLEYKQDDIYVLGANSLIMHSESEYDIEQLDKSGIRHAKIPYKSYIGFEPHDATINFAHCILMDYRRTQDWFYSLRWIPPAEFKRILCFKYKIRQEYVYLTHKKLHPLKRKWDHWSLTREGRMSPQDYKDVYAELIGMAPHSQKLLDPRKYLNKRASNIGQLRNKIYGNLGFAWDDWD